MLIPRDTSIQAYNLFQLLSENGIPIVYSSSKIPNIKIPIDEGVLSVDALKFILADHNIAIEPLGQQYILTYNTIDPIKSINGYIRDKANGEALIGAIVFIDSTYFSTTNAYGYFSLETFSNKDSLLVQYLGYETGQFTIEDLDESKSLYLSAISSELEAITVNALTYREKVESLIPSTHRIDFDKKGEIPYFMGEVDVLQESLMLPGIKTLGEDASGLHVRGGNSDQNLILLDEAIIYNPNHFFGLISVFNPEAVNQVNIMKGFLPPSFGGRGSSVISINQREGNFEQFSGAGGIGLISARLLLEGPIVKNKASFLVSARQSIFDLSAATSNRNVLQNSRTSFQDLNIKTNWRWNEKNNFFLSAYTGSDRSRSVLEETNRWGNATSTFRWNHLWNDRLYSKLSLIFSDYEYRVVDPIEVASFIGKSEIQNINLKHDTEWKINNRSTLSFGAQLLWHKLSPGERLPFDTLSSTLPVILDTENGLEHGTYFSHHWNITPRLSILYGIRLTGLSTYGPGPIYEFTSEEPRSRESIADTINYRKNERIDEFINWEPRISLNFKTSDQSAIKSSFSRTNQYLQLISSTAIPSPTDIWKLSNRYLRPLMVDQVSTGYYYFSKNNQWQWSIESYYKIYQNLIEYKNGANLILNPVPETELVGAEGRSYGLELMLKRQSKAWSGWISYTLSKTERRVISQFEEELVNGGDFYPDNHDKTHDLTAVVKYQLNESWILSSAFYYNSGRPITFPEGKYEIGNTVVPDFGNRNQDRISDYHRLDFSCRWSPKGNLRRDWKHYWTLSVYNTYARNNAYTYVFEASETVPNETEITAYSIFGTIIPSVTYNFSF